MYNLDNRLPVELRLTQNNRLQFDRPDNMQTVLARLQTVDRTLITGQGGIQPENQTLSAKIYKPWNLIHLFQRFFSTGILVEQLGMRILIDAKDLKAKTGATDAQIARLKRNQQLIVFITISLVSKTLGINRSAEQILVDIGGQQPTPLTARGLLPGGFKLDVPTGLATIVNHATNRVEVIFPREPGSVMNVQQTLHEEAASSSGPAQPSKTIMDSQVVNVRLKNGTIEHWEKDKTLGKGGFGKVIQVKNRTGLFEGAKYPRKRKGEKGVDDVQKEYDAHQELFKNRKNGIWGFQRPIKEQFEITFRKKHPKSGENPIRTVTANRTHIYSKGCYKTSVSAKTEGGFEQLLPDFHQMMLTLHYMEKHGLYHNDIKSTNLLMDMIDGLQVVHLSDLSGIRPNHDQRTSITYTKHYMPRNDLSVIRNANLSVADRSRARRKQDVFAMGTVIYKILVGTLPHQVDADKFPIPGAYRPINSLYPGAVPEEFDLLLARMLDFDCNTRIGGTEAWNEFSQILAQYPNVEAQIAANIQYCGFDPNDLA
jgi:hypothetical protein